MVDAYAQRRVVLAADVEQRQQLLLDFQQLVGIFLVGVFQLLERARRVDVVAGVYSDLLGIQRRHLCYVLVEVYVGNERGVISPCPQSGVDVLQVLCLAHALCGQSDVLAARFDDAFRLCHAAFGIVCRCRRHRLDAYRVIAAERGGAHLHFDSLSSDIIEHGI